MQKADVLVNWEINDDNVKLATLTAIKSTYGELFKLLEARYCDGLAERVVEAGEVLLHAVVQGSLV